MKVEVLVSRETLVLFYLRWLLSKHLSHTLSLDFLLMWGIKSLWVVQFPQAREPQILQWCLNTVSYERAKVGQQMKDQ